MDESLRIFSKSYHTDHFLFHIDFRHRIAKTNEYTQVAKRNTNVRRRASSHTRKAGGYSSCIACIQRPQIVLFPYYSVFYSLFSSVYSDKLVHGLIRVFLLLLLYLYILTISICVFTRLYSNTFQRFRRLLLFFINTDILFKILCIASYYIIFRLKCIQIL